jgi:PAS domain S-box-containing protein
MSTFGSEQDTDEHFRFLVESARDYAIFGLDTEGRVTSWNPGAERIKGYTPEEILGQHFRVLFPPALRERKHPEHEMEQALVKGVFHSEEPRLRKDGTLFEAEVTLRVLRDDRGRPRGFVKVTRDITERKRAELERERLVAELQGALRSRDEFLSVVAHELRTPLTPLHLKLQSLRREAQAAIDHHLPCKRVLGDLDSAERQVRKLATLISDLLDASSARQGQLGLVLAEVDLSALVMEVAAAFGPQSDSAGCEVRVSADHPLCGQWDRLRVEQVVTNLLSNALKYGAGKPVHLTTERDGAWAKLTVRDEGIGIDAEHLPRIFGRFERAVSGRHYGGLGLGLYITHQIVQALGGTLQVESELGQGARFEVRLPLPSP